MQINLSRMLRLRLHSHTCLRARINRCTYRPWPSFFIAAAMRDICSTSIQPLENAISLGQEILTPLTMFDGRNELPALK
jgi:hypothetical protein